MVSALWSVLPLALGLLLWPPAGASGPCWESSKCQDLASEASVLVSSATGTALVPDPPPGTGAVGWGVEVMPSPWGDPPRAGVMLWTPSPLGFGGLLPPGFTLGDDGKISFLSLQGMNQQFGYRLYTGALQGVVVTGWCRGSPG